VSSLAFGSKQRFPKGPGYDGRGGDKMLKEKNCQKKRIGENIQITGRYETDKVEERESVSPRRGN